MPGHQPIRARLALLGAENELPGASRNFRSAAVMSHRGPGDSRPWHWRGDPTAPVVVVLGWGRPAGDGTVDRPTTMLLVPGRETIVARASHETTVSVWVPGEAVSDLTRDARELPETLQATPLTAGLRAFAVSLLPRDADATPYTDYLVERLLIEMVFGATMESMRTALAAVTAERPIDRARSVMLLRRNDPAFDVAQLALELHMSVRQVQRLFAKGGSTPADELRGMRVDLARTILGDDAYAPLTVEQVATHCGFRSAGALRRALAAHGVSLRRRRAG